MQFCQDHVLIRYETANVTFPKQICFRECLAVITISNDADIQNKITQQDDCYDKYIAISILTRVVIVESENHLITMDEVNNAWLSYKNVHN